MPDMPEFRIRYKDMAKREDTFTIKEWQKLYRFMREWVKKKNVAQTRISVKKYGKKADKKMLKKKIYKDGTIDSFDFINIRHKLLWIHTRSVNNFI